MPLDDTNYQPQSIVSVLTEGRRRVETSWFHGYPGNQVSPPNLYCGVTAISRQNEMDTLAALRYLALAIFGWENLNGIVPWNDDLERTRDEVLAAYDAAIKLAQHFERVHAA